MVKKRWFIPLITTAFISSSICFAAINYGEYFPNGSTVLQSKSNGWASPVSGWKKEIETIDGCRAITSSYSQSLFIPTKTSLEWGNFSSNKPTGVSISSCGGNECGQNGLYTVIDDGCFDDGGPSGGGDSLYAYCDSGYLRFCLSEEPWYCPWRDGQYGLDFNIRFWDYGNTGENFWCWDDHTLSIYNSIR